MVHSYADIALWLTEQRVPTRLGANRWSDSSVGNMLKNPAYMGLPVTYNQYDRKGSEKPKEEWIKVTFPPLISKDRWNQIQQRIQLNKKKPKKTHKGEYKDRFICNEILWCGECGSKVKKHLKKQNGKLYPYYMCDAKNRSEKNLKMQGRQHCTLKSPNADMIDDRMWFEVVKLLSNPYHFIKEWLKDPDHEELKAKYDRINKRIQDLENEIKRNTKDLSKLTGLSRKQMISQLDNLEKEYQSEQIKLAELESEMEFYNKKEDKLKEFEKVIASFSGEPNFKNKTKELQYRTRLQGEIIEHLDSLPVKDKKRLIEAVVRPEAGGKITLEYPTGYDLANDEQWNRMTKEELILKLM